MTGRINWFELFCADCLTFCDTYPDNAFDLVIGSPPYHGKMNRYGSTKQKMTDVEWAEWMTRCVLNFVRVCKGPVIIVANGCVQKGKYLPSCERLIVNCADAGCRCERPLIWHKNAPPNRKDWWANNWEYVLAFGNKPRVWNWQDIADPPKYQSGGRFHQRTANGKRRKGNSYPQNKLTRPKDVLRVTVGGGHMGSKLAHENEAPFPEKLVEPIITALTDPLDLVLDPFCGSGTTLAVCERLNRRSIGVDNRQSQIELAESRLHVQK